MQDVLKYENKIAKKNKEKRLGKTSTLYAIPGID